MKKEFVIGRKDGRNVWININLTTKQGNELDTHLNPINQYTTLSISAHSKNWSGQAIDEIRTLDECYLPNDQLDKLIEIWEQWHLNDMKAGCVHQTDWNPNERIDIVKVKCETWRVKDKSIHGILGLLNIEKKADYERKINTIDDRHYVLYHMVRKIKEAQYNGIVYEPKDDTERSWLNEDGPITITTDNKLARWTYPSEHPKGVLMKECNQCGYKFGSSWLVEPLPQDVIDFITNLQVPTHNPLNETEQWMIDNGIQCTTIRYAFKNPHIDNKYMDHFEYFFNHQGSKSTGFYYSTGYEHRLGHDEYLSFNQKQKLFYGYQNKHLKGIELLNRGQFIDGDHAGVVVPNQPYKVFDAIMDDIASLGRYGDYTEMAVEMGYPLDTKEDRHKVQKMYQAMEEQRYEMEMLIGDDLIEDYINNIL